MLHRAVPALRTFAPVAAPCVPASLWTGAGSRAVAASASSLAGAQRPTLGRPLALPADLQPQQVNGVWRKPRLSARRAAKLRKAALESGKLYTGCTEEGGWDPEWDRARKPTIMKPLKGRGHDRTQPLRIAKIQKALADQDKKMADFKKQLPAKPKKGIQAFIKKEKWEK